MKAQLNTQKMEQEHILRKDILLLEHQMNLQLKGMEVQGMRSRETQKEDRKDQRTKIQATQQSELIDQRQTGKPPKNFETEDAGNMFDLGSINI